MDEESVQIVLAARHAVEIWNHDDEVLREAAKRPHARSESLRGWIAARLNHRSEWHSEFADVAPIWPRAIPFPVSVDDREEHGAIGFVSAIPAADQALPAKENRPDALTATVQSILDWLTHDLAQEWPGKLNLVAQVWVPLATKGPSIGLAALMAGLVAALSQTDARLRGLAFFFPMTGEIDLANELLLPVDAHTMPGKRAAAQRIGCKEIYIARGQPAAPANGLRPIVLDARLRGQTLKRLLQELARVNPILYEGFHIVRKLARRLVIPLDALSQFLPGVLTRLADDPRDIESVRADLNLPPDPRDGSALERWERLVDEYVPTGRDPDEDDAKPMPRVMRLCYWMLERHAEETKRRDLQALTVHVSKKDYRGTLPAETALTLMERFESNGNAPTSENSSKLEEWFEMSAIAAGVRGIKNQSEFLTKLLEKRNAKLMALAIAAATRIYGWNRGQVDEFRTWVGAAMGAKDRAKLPEWTSLLEMIDVPCRIDFSAMFGPRDPGAWSRQLRARTVKMRRFPVTNQEFKWFDPKYVPDAHSPHDDSPAVNVSWFQAYAFAFWAGMSLPTRLEWLSAAVPEGWPHPYQYSDAIPDHLNYDQRRNGTTRFEERRKIAAEDTACWDLTGNVWEWVLDWCGPRGPASEESDARGLADRKMALGGGWKSPREHLVLTSFCPLLPGARLDDVGFRCVELQRANGHGE